MGSPSPGPLVLDIYTVFGAVPPRGVAEPGTTSLRALMSKHGVVGAVTISTRGLFHSAAAGNRETAALCGESGGTLLPAAVLDPRQPGSAQAANGARMLCVLAATQGWPIRFAPLAEELKATAASNLPLYWEAVRPGDATAAAEMLAATGYNGAVIFGGVSGDTLTEVLSVAKTADRFFLSTDGLRAIGEVAFAVQTLGAERVVYGSGAPAFRTMAGTLALVRAAGLSPEDAAQILGGNAKRLLAAGGGAAQ